MLVRFRFTFCFFFKQKTSYEMRISDWSSDVCSSDLRGEPGAGVAPLLGRRSGVRAGRRSGGRLARRSEEHTSELQSLMRISYAVFCLKKKNKNNRKTSSKYASIYRVHTQKHQYRNNQRQPTNNKITIDKRKAK